MAKIETYHKRSWGNILGTTVLACWALYTTVLSHDRIFYGVATFAAQQSQRVATKYAPPVIIQQQIVKVPTPQEKEYVLGGHYIMTDNKMAQLMNGAATP